MHHNYSKTSPDRVWDYVIIGSGMGGMTCAALLSDFGKRVLLLERHYVPGGMTHTFKRKRWRWDVGVHAIGEVSDRSVVGRFLTKLTRSRLQWDSLGEVYDRFEFPDNFQIAFPNDRRQFVENLCEAFPAEQRAIDDYVAGVRRAAGAMRGYYMARMLPRSLASVGDLLLARDAKQLLARTTAEQLARSAGSEKLRTVLTAQWGYYGSPPSQSAWAMHALVAKHFWYGAFYPRHGSRAIADAMTATIADGGGTTRIGADVESIVIEGGRAVGVRLPGGECVRARRVVSAAGALATVQALLPETERRRPWAQQVAALRSSPTYVCLYIGFRGDIRQAGASSSNRWFYSSWDGEKGQWDVGTPGVKPPVLYVSFPSLKDPQHDAGEELLHTGEVVTFVPYGAFEKWRGTDWMHRGADYEAFKEELTERLTDELLQHMPGLRSLIAYRELSTPLTAEHFVGASRGAIYGLESTPERFANAWLRARTPVPGLFMAGCDVAAPGVIGAMMGGMMAAVSAEPRRAIPYLREVLA